MITVIIIIVIFVANAFINSKDLKYVQAANQVCTTMVIMFIVQSVAIENITVSAINHQYSMYRMLVVFFCLFINPKEKYSKELLFIVKEMECDCYKKYYS